MNVIKNTYLYESFKDELITRPIRLLRLLAAPSFTDEIKCELFNSTLDAAEDFEALSYTWGEVTEISTVILHSQKHHVTKNLVLALRHLRYQDRQRVLWVDALCIDQGNVEERNYQVPHMGHIYREGGARRVIVWLGEVLAAHIALEFGREFQRRMDEETVHLMAKASEEKLASCRSLFLDPPWWSRVWILQEVIHSGDVMVYFGAAEPVPLDDICSAYYYYKIWETVHTEGHLARIEKEVEQGVLTRWPVTREYALHLQRNLDSLIRSTSTISDVRIVIWDFRVAAKNPKAKGVVTFPPNLSGLLMRFPDQKATDERDLVYAYLGMAAPGSNGTDVAVDYSLSKKILYTRVARALLKKVLLGLLWIESPDRPVKPNRDLPSWVPDYKIKQKAISSFLLNTSAPLKADFGFPSVDQEPRFRDPLDSDILTLRGVYVAVVTGTYDTQATDMVQPERQESVRLITYDQDPERRFQNPADFPDATASMEATRTMTHNNTSWGPCHTIIGDIIIVAAGCRIPFVIRRTANNQYLFVGSCWLIDAEPAPGFSSELDSKESGVSPIMFGSACKGLSDNWKAEEFQIC